MDSKSIAKKALVVSLAGALTFSSLPANLFQIVVASEVDLLAEEESSPIEVNFGLVTAKMELDESKYYYDNGTNYLYIRTDSKFNISYSCEEEGVVMTVDGGDCVDNGDGSYTLSSIYASSIIRFTGSTWVEESRLSDYFDVIYPSMEGVVFVNDLTEITAQGLDYTGDMVEGYFKDNVLSFNYEYSLDSNLSLDFCNLGFKLNGVDVPEGSYTVAGNVITAVVDLSDSRYNLDTVDGECSFVASLVDCFGKEVSSENTISVDGKAPVIENIVSKWVSGTDGKAYFEKDGEGYANISFSVVDGGSGVDSLEILNGDNSVPYTEENGVYSVRFLGDEAVSPVFNVKDKLGNSKSYGVSDLFGCIDNTVNFGIPVPTVNFAIISGDNVGDWYKGDSVVLKMDISNTIGNISKVKYVIGGEEFTRDVNSSSCSIEENIAPYVNENGIVGVEVFVYDSNGNEFVSTSSYKVDNDKPESGNIVVSGSEVNVYDNVGYVYESLTIGGEFSDNESGVSSVEVIKDGEVVGNSLPYTIDSNGKYSFKVTDNTGNITTISLKELVGKEFEQIVVTKNSPEITFDNIGGTKIDDVYWSKSWEGLSYIVSAENFKSMKVEVKDSEGTYTLEPTVDEENNNKYLLSFTELKEGINTVIIKVEDKSGVSTTKEINLGVDTTKPNRGGLSLDNGNKVYVYDGIGYSFYDVVISGVPDDVGSDVKSIKVLKGDEVVSESLPYTISESGVYRVVVTDNLGNSSTFHISDIRGAEAFNELVVSDNTPNITLGRINGVYIDGIYWNKLIDSFTYSITECNNLKSTTVKVENGGNSYTLEPVTGDGVNYTVSLKDLKEGINKILVEVSDKNGEGSTAVFSVGIDNTKPEVSNLVASDSATVYVYDEGANKGKIAYSFYDIIMSGVGSDIGSGVKGIEVLCNGKVVGDGLPYTISSSGRYSVKVTDNVGNSTVYSLDEIMGKDFDILVISKNKPSISHSGFSEGYDFAGVKWYKGLDSLKYELTYDNLLGTWVDVTNGSSSYRLEATSEDGKNYSVALSGLKEGVNTLIINVNDKNGTSSDETITVGIDHSSPEITNANVDSSYNDLSGFLWFKKEPNMVVSSKDTFINVKNYIILNKNGNDRIEESDLIVLKDGDYAIKVVDYLGNTSGAYNFNELLGTKGSVVAVDGTGPKINCSRPAGDVDGWYANDVTYSANLSDDSGIHTAEMYINGKLVDSVATSSVVLSETLRGNTSSAQPNTDGSYTVRIVVTDNSGNSSEWSDTIRIDKDKPVINKFVITSKNGYHEGSDINGSDKYGFYLKEATDVEIYVSDGSVSSGMKSVHYTLIEENGSKNTGVSSIVGGVAVVSIPNNFKGFITAYPVDMVGNEGDVDRPDGIITEDGNVHVNTSGISMGLPATNYQDSKGYSLYNSNVVIDMGISNRTSGIRKIEWGIGDDRVDSVSIDNNGKITGDVDYVNKTEKNLVISVDKDLHISNNENGIYVWVKVEDRVGHVSEASRIISIDKDLPVIDVSYDTTTETNYYDGNRVATVKITERNFDSEQVVFDGNYGEIKEWVYEGNDVWSTKVVFSKDDEYQWSVNCTDMAGNVAEGYSSESFIVDKTNPVLNVVFDNNDVSNSKYYDKNRTASVRIIEKNFDKRLVSLVGSGTITGWSHDGDVHTANIVFNEDGEYEFSLMVTDLSGNTSEKFNSGDFIIDTVEPEITISGVQNGVSYKKGLEFTVSISDKYIDAKMCTAELVGRTSGSIKLKANIGESSGQYVFEGLPKDLKYDDLYTLKVTVYDKAGNTSEENLVFSINRFGSQYSFLNEHLLGNITNAPEDIKLVETSVDRLSLEECKVVVIRDGNVVEVDKKYINISESGGKKGPWEYTYTVNKGAFNVDGKYQIQVFSKAQDGTDYSSMVQEYSFLLDTTNPEIILSGVNDDEFYKVVSRKVSIDVRDLSGVGSIKANLDGEEVELVDDDGIYYLTIEENNSKRNLEVFVVDNAGNESSVEVVDFMVSSSTIQSIIHSDWFKWVAGGVGALAVGVLALLSGKRRKDINKEKSSEDKSDKEYEESTTETLDSPTTKED